MHMSVSMFVLIPYHESFIDWQWYFSVEQQQLLLLLLLFLLLLAFHCYTLSYFGTGYKVLCQFLEQLEVQHTTSMCKLK